MTDDPDYGTEKMMTTTAVTTARVFPEAYVAAMEADLLFNANALIPDSKIVGDTVTVKIPDRFFSAESVDRVWDKAAAFNSVKRRPKPSFEPARRKYR